MLSTLLPIILGVLLFIFAIKWIITGCKNAVLKIGNMQITREVVTGEPVSPEVLTITLSGAKELVGVSTRGGNVVGNNSTPVNINVPGCTQKDYCTQVNTIMQVNLQNTVPCNKGPKASKNASNNENTSKLCLDINQSISICKVQHCHP